MSSENWTVSGRQFRTQSDYEAAARDQKKIDIIESKTDFNNPKDVLELYAEMQSGGYHFETMVGNDFDDKIYELSQKYKEAHTNKEGKKNGSSKKTDKSSKSNKTSVKKKEKVSEKISLSDFDEEMRKEIETQLELRDKRRKWIVALCTLCAVACFGYFIVYYFFAGRTNADYEQLAGLKNSDVLANDNSGLSLVGTKEDIDLPDILNDYKTLYNKNKKLIGWLKIDDTVIDYPVMQTVNNDYYLTNNFNQEYDKNGSIFMDYQCKAYPRSQNIILYGHHMKSGQMFGDLANYAKESYGERHSIIKFDTLYEKSTYQVMYVFRTRVYKENEIVFKYYQFIDANSEEEFNSYMNEMAEMSLYDTGVTAVYGDELLTLSTCDNSQTDGRFVIVAKRVS